MLFGIIYCLPFITASLAKLYFFIWYCTTSARIYITSKAVDFLLAQIQFFFHPDPKVTFFTQIIKENLKSSTRKLYKQ